MQRPFKPTINMDDFRLPVPKVMDMKPQPYKGDELKDYTGRIGAMDAYKLPSLMGTGLVVPKRYRGEVK